MNLRPISVNSRFVEYFMYRSIPLCSFKFTALGPVRNAFDAGKFITLSNGRWLGPGNLDFFQPQMALAKRLDAISQGTKKSPFPGLNPLTLALVMDLPASKALLLGRRSINGY